MELCVNFCLPLIDVKVRHYNTQLAPKVWAEQGKQSHPLTSVLVSSNKSTYNGALPGNEKSWILHLYVKNHHGFNSGSKEVRTTPFLPVDQTQNEIVSKKELFHQDTSRNQQDYKSVPKQCTLISISCNYSP